MPAETPYVWAFDLGWDFGPLVVPLHPCVPAAAARRAPFDELMALVEVMRVGRVREREITLVRLDEILGGGR